MIVSDGRLRPADGMDKVLHPKATKPAEGFFIGGALNKEALQTIVKFAEEHGLKVSKIHLESASTLTIQLYCDFNVWNEGAIGIVEKLSKSNGQESLPSK